MPRKLPDQAYLKEIFDFDEGEGVLFWRERKEIAPRSNGRYAGKVAGYKFTGTNGKSYVRVVIDYKKYMLHRVIWKYLYNSEPSQIDHIDGNGQNNSPCNLRASDEVSNQRNKRLSSANQSGCVGVNKRKGRNKWRAEIKVNGKCISLGSFETFDAAVSARKSAEQEYGFHKEHGSERPL